MTTVCNDRSVHNSDGTPPERPAVTAVGVSVRRGGRVLLHDVNVAVWRDELVALAGPSGAGKTTLLRVLGGLLSPAGGRVVHERRPGDGAGAVGFVPQDDIVHRELSVRSTLRYAAALRLPTHVQREERDHLVDTVMAELKLTASADVRVGSLSGGQRKRVSIAVELLRRPSVLLLDEPTSGLDPATASGVMALLRRLARNGVAVVVTTHREADVMASDRVVFLAAGGRVALDGEVTLILRRLEVESFTDVYLRLDEAGAEPVVGLTPPTRTQEPSARSDRQHAAHLDEDSSSGRGMPRWRQALLLTRRSAEVMANNRLTLAVLLGSPVLVISMMATLFGRWSHDGSDAAGITAVQVTYWLAFAGFFFGLTYGLLQVVTERAVLERERFAGLSVAAYLTSKVLVLAPVLTAVAVVLLGTLRALGRLPALDWPEMATLLAVLVLEALSALVLGLLASAAVGDPAQATLALPLLCFPQVLFAGAVVPVVEMTAPGRLLSVALANRWAFEGLGRGLGLGALADRPGVAVHGGTFDGSVLSCAFALAAGVLVLSTLTWCVVRSTTPAPSAVSAGQQRR